MFKGKSKQRIILLCFLALLSNSVNGQELQDGLGRIIGYIEDGKVMGVSGYIRGYIEDGNIKNAEGQIIGSIRHGRVRNAQGEKLGYISAHRVRDNNRNLVARLRRGEVMNVSGKVVGRYEGVAPTEAALFLYYFFRPPIHR